MIKESRRCKHNPTVVLGNQRSITTICLDCGKYLSKGIWMGIFHLNTIVKDDLLNYMGGRGFLI
jgi:hypothetical protein